MTHDEAEFLISQQLDGTLETADADRLRAAIDADAIVAAMWREHQALDAALRATQVVAQPSSEAELAEVAAYIDDGSSQTFKIGGASRFSWGTPLAAAAMLAIGLTIGIVATRSERGLPRDSVAVQPPTPTPVRTTPSIALSGAEFATADGTGSVDVEVGTPTDLTPDAVASLYVSDRFAHSRIVIQPAGYVAADVFE